MVRRTSLSRLALALALGAGAALIIATAALAQTSSSTPTPGSPTAAEAPKKSEGLVARTKAKVQARITGMKRNWAESRFRTQTCRRIAIDQKVALQDRAAFIHDCTRRMAAGKAPATGPNVLPALLLSPEAQKPSLGGMTATGDGGAAIDHDKKK
jgi:hypothetical protein